MASRNVTITTDDLDGTTIHEGQGRKIHLSLDDASCDLDLSNEHIKALQQALEPYFRAARGRGNGPKANGNGAPRFQGAVPTQPARAKNLKEVREWARRNGYDVSERGRISYSVMDAYTKAHL